jgi:hypothetical protein
VTHEPFRTGITALFPWRRGTSLEPGSAGARQIADLHPILEQMERGMVPRDGRVIDADLILPFAADAHGPRFG